MDAESIEKEIKELNQNISNKREVAQPKLKQLEIIQKELNEGAVLIIKWQNQIEALQKVLNG